MHFAIRGLPCQSKNCTKTNQSVIRPEGILRDLNIRTKDDKDKLRQVEQSNEGMANSEHCFLMGHLHSALASLDSFL